MIGQALRLTRRKGMTRVLQPSFNDVTIGLHRRQKDRKKKIVRCYHSLVILLPACGNTITKPW